MKLTYIYHSGYIVEGDFFVMIIDYYKDSADIPDEGVVFQYLRNTTKKVYVLSTHSHHDHFNPKILSWKTIHPDITYIFSQDILDDKLAKIDDAIYLDKGVVYKDHVYIKAYGSTDKGVSFYIEVEGKKIFHAGDLNNWHWNEESTEDEIKEAEDFYESELSDVAKDISLLDLAMFPVDPRLGKDYMKGAEEFVSKIKTRIFAPMHFDQAYDQAAEFAKFASTKDCKCISWKDKGESYLF